VVGILGSDKDAGVALDPSQQHQFIGEPKAIHESSLDITGLVRGVVKHGGHESTEAVGFARPMVCAIAQWLEQHPHREFLSACRVDSSYDSSGNITSKIAGSTTTSYAYNAVNELCWAYTGSSGNACSSAPTGATTYTFDSNGNETASSSSDSFSYNSKNQTTSITHGGTTLSSLAYSGGDQTNRTAAGSTTFGNAASATQIATTSGSSTYYLRDAQGNLIGEKIGSNHYYYLIDALGSIVAAISGDGLTVSDRYGYDPYGSTSYHSGSVANPWGYAGGYTDQTGLIHFGARYYDPSTGRWTQADPLGSAESGPYVYAGANPIDNVDPTGLLWCCSFGSYGGWWGKAHYAAFYLSSTEIYLLADLFVISLFYDVRALLQSGLPWQLAVVVISLIAGVLGWMLLVNSRDGYRGAVVVVGMVDYWWWTAFPFIAIGYP
jgi:RHS repeat-associated protein